jgi:poly-gamma-glutamate synthesis protein (capsule biosynthesis protein)
MEEYNGSTIIYGQGNTLFDHKFAEKMPTWHTSILVEVELCDGKFTVNYIPIEKCGEFTALSDNPEILDGFYSRSEEIKEEGFVKRNYTEFVMSDPDTFETYIKLFADAGKLGTLGGAGTRNRLTCDPHREFIITYVENLHELYKDD